MRMPKIEKGKWLDKLDVRFKALPRKKQFKYTLVLFWGYAVLTAGVVFHAWFHAGQPIPPPSIEHIENPVLQKKRSAATLPDSLSIILKNKLHERK